jgi:hypothetical protein
VSGSRQIKLQTDNARDAGHFFHAKKADAFAQAFLGDGCDPVGHGLGYPATERHVSLAGIKPPGFAGQGDDLDGFRCRLEASRLTITAGRVLRISPPMAGSQPTHQTSPRFIGHVASQVLGPLESLCLAPAIGGHGLVGRIELRIHDMRPRQRVDKTADAPGADLGVQALIDLFRDGDGKLPSYKRIYTYYT